MGTFAAVGASVRRAWIVVVAHARCGAAADSRLAGVIRRARVRIVAGLAVFGWLGRACAGFGNADLGQTRGASGTRDNRGWIGCATPLGTSENAVTQVGIVEGGAIGIRLAGAGIRAHADPAGALVRRSTNVSVVACRSISGNQHACSVIARWFHTRFERDFVDTIKGCGTLRGEFGGVGAQDEVVSEHNVGKKRASAGVGGYVSGGKLRGAPSLPVAGP